MVMGIELAIACTRSAQNLVSVQVIRLSARCDVSFPKGFETLRMNCRDSASPGYNEGPPMGDKWAFATKRYNALIWPSNGRERKPWCSTS